MFDNYRALISKLTLPMNFAWLLMHIGLAFMFAGLVERSAPLSWTGLGATLLGLGIALALRGEAATLLSTALIISAVVTMLSMVIVVPICALAVVGIAIFEGLSMRGLLNILHFLGVMVAFGIVTGAATAAKTSSTSQPEEAP